MHSYSKLSPLYRQGDIKYYWRVHCKKMEEKGEKPVTYPRFWDRLQRGWVLKIAIETPNSHPRLETSLPTTAWRSVTLAVMDELYDDTTHTDKTLDELIEMNRIQMPKPKPSLWKRIKRLFSRKREK